MNYKGVIIEESLKDKSVLKDFLIVDTKVEQVVEKHKTPWLKQWTLHNVEISEEKADEVAKDLSISLELNHPWYADFKNKDYHFIIYRGKVFKVDLKNPVLYKEAVDHGVSMGIPPYQVDFAPEDKTWKR